MRELTQNYLSINVYFAVLCVQEIIQSEAAIVIVVFLNLALFSSYSKYRVLYFVRF